MTKSGEQHLESTRDDLTCPECDYALRGLEGLIVTCPECGMRIDVGVLVTQRWTKQWYQAPGYSLLTIPVAIVMLGFFATLVVSAFVVDAGGPVEVVALTAIVMGLLWLGSIAMVRARFRSTRAILLALLAHAIVVAYGVGVIGCLIMVARAFTATRNRSVGGAVVFIAAAVMLAGLVYLGRRGERFMAAYCIRRHLAREATGGK